MMNTRPTSNGLDLPLYRDYAIAMLKRYFRMSMDIGRLPSVLGGQGFRAKVTSYRMHTFEEIVIFVHDMERCMEKLDIRSLRIIAAVVLMEYTQDQAADLLGMSAQHVRRVYPQALDELSALMLDCGLMKTLSTLPPKKPVRRAEIVKEIQALAEA